MDDTERKKQINIIATRSGSEITVTLCEDILPVYYTRTYVCHITDEDDVSLPNDLNIWTQNLLRSVCLKFNHANTREGDSFTK